MYICTFCRFSEILWIDLSGEYDECPYRSGILRHQIISFVRAISFLLNATMISPGWRVNETNIAQRVQYQVALGLGQIPFDKLILGTRLEISAFWKLCLTTKCIMGCIPNFFSSSHI